jgi:hypothetical protein
MSHAIANGYRSGLEELNASLLDKLKVPYEYEPKDKRIKYTQPAKTRTYTPDFVLGNGIIIETKGRFTTEDRQKHLMIRECHPQLDIRFVFSNPNAKLNKGSSTTYADWCRKHDFQFATKTIPLDWLKESVDRRSL